MIYHTYPELRKKPPNSMNGMIIGGPTDAAMLTLLLAQDIR